MNHNAHHFAKKLRRNQTEAEKLLWSFLRDKKTGFKFRRQNPIDKYIVDFVCIERGLIIELDGGQHTPEIDQQRTNDLQAMGYAILRFWNNDVLANIDGVYQTIIDTLKE